MDLCASRGIYTLATSQVVIESEASMIHLGPIPADLAILRSLWNQTAAASAHSFFLSWHWIGTWLTTLQPYVAPSLLTVQVGQAPPALGLMVGSNQIRRGVLHVRTLALNTTGDPQFDCICTEYNGLLAADEVREQTWSEVLEYFSGRDDWDEIDLRGVCPSLITPWEARGEAVRESRRDVCRFVPLKMVREAGSCLRLWSSRPRTRVQHTMRSVKARLGEVQVRVATTTAEAQAAFELLESLHTSTWRERGESGSFGRPFFREFHRALIERSFDSGCIQFLTVTAGGTPLAVLYSFVHQGRVSYYQGGVNYPVAEKADSIGLLAHAMAIDHNAGAGHDFYDLLAGDSQYKRAITPHTIDLWWGGLQAPRAKLRLEGLAATLYRKIRRTG